MSFESLYVRETGLVTLDGLRGSLVSCNIWLHDNPVLTDISVLGRAARTLANFRVVDNPSLATCHVQAIAEALPMFQEGYHCAFLGQYTDSTRQIVIDGNDDEAVCE